jgi:hypothetical protein
MFYRWCDLYKCKRPTVAELKQPQNNMMWSTEVQTRCSDSATCNQVYAFSM